MITMLAISIAVIASLRCKNPSKTTSTATEPKGPDGNGERAVIECDAGISQPPFNIAHFQPLTESRLRHILLAPAPRITKHTAVRFEWDQVETSE